MWGLGFDWDVNKENKDVNFKFYIGPYFKFCLQRKNKNFRSILI